MYHPIRTGLYRSLLLGILLMAPAPPAGTTEIGPLRVGDPFPLLALPPLDGGAPRTLAEQLNPVDGGKKYILHLFASW